MKKAESGLPLSKVVTALETLAPLDLAEEWDNVGLLWAPTRPRRVRRIMLTIDSIPEVVSEAIQTRCDLLLSYHPPLFSPINRFASDDPAANRIQRLIEAGIAVYSPHTALDHAADGVNDWLARGVRGQWNGTIECADDHSARVVVMDRPVSLRAFQQQVIKFLKTPYLRVATPPKPRPIRRVACCAGAGASVLLGLDADVYVTGEMKHHDVLAAISRGVTVILSEHTHTERCYLPVLKRRLLKALENHVEIEISRKDSDPLHLVKR